jgi:hypothetical protein
MKTEFELLYSFSFLLLHTLFIIWTMNHSFKLHKHVKYLHTILCDKFLNHIYYKLRAGKQNTNVQYILPPSPNRYCFLIHNDDIYISINIFTWYILAIYTIT